MDGAAVEVTHTISPASNGQDGKAGSSDSASMDADHTAHHVQGQDVLQQDLNGAAHQDSVIANGINSQVQTSQGQWNPQAAILLQPDVRVGDTGAVSIATLVPQELAVQGHIVLAQYVMPASQNQTDEMVSRDGAYLSLGGSFPANPSQWTGQLVSDTGIKNPLPDPALISAGTLMLQDQSGQAAQKLIKLPIDTPNAKLLSMQIAASQQGGKVFNH
jgi:hypothetical protein